MSSSMKVFVNLPVKNLNKSIEFFTKLGFKFNAQFTDEKATCMIIGEDSYSMLVVEEFFKTFTKKPISDATKSTEVVVSLSVDSKAHVDDFVHKALAAGGKPANEPTDHGFMYEWGFQDLDGHLWGIFWMDPSVIVQDGG